ncbi:MAG: dihydroorotate dehydrogenase electron transfer subunit [Oscillospiraceae bacterium]|nr:dihydroorotate dehydrogenase electron transfer subunit [Oscillospiraceae bacterium]MDD4368569.1 dihydroorotate dehydrogenase electron transfer subunit [Oscillospiraceae bacterium]
MTQVNQSPPRPAGTGLNQAEALDLSKARSGQLEYAAEVISCRQLNAGTFWLQLYCPEVALSCQPGQFVNLSCSQFLRRPFGVAQVDRAAGTIAIGIQLKGQGSADLAASKPGRVLSLLGPLGHGFTLPQSGPEQQSFGPAPLLLATGGGSGLFPLLFALQEARLQGCRTAAVLGFRSRDRVVLADSFRAVCSEGLTLATDDGSLGVRGTVAAALAQLELSPAVAENNRRAAEQAPVTVIACGPQPMLAAAAHWASARHYACQVSLEERMACGFGLCRTCACQITRDGRPEMLRVCYEGPVFKAEEVFPE